MMKTKKWFAGILTILLCIGLSGCNGMIVKESLNPIHLSGTPSAFASMDRLGLASACMNRHVEVKGIVTSGGYTIFYIGDLLTDGMRVSCVFKENSNDLETVRLGDEILVDGVCTDLVGDHMYLEGCTLLNRTPKDQVTTTATTSTTVSPAVVVTAATNPTVAPGVTVITTVTPGVTSTTAAPVPTLTQGSLPAGLYEGDGTLELTSIVWLPTHGGIKYHTTETCSGMEDPRRATLAEALTQGFGPCELCC